MGIEIRVAETDAELEAWRQVRIAVLPDERCASVEWMRKLDDPRAASISSPSSTASSPGRGCRGRSDFGYAGLHPRVLPDFRRRGVGTALLRALAAHAVDARLRPGRHERRRSRLARVRRAVRRRRGRPSDRTGAGRRARSPRPSSPTGSRSCPSPSAPSCWARGVRPARAAGVRGHGHVPTGRRRPASSGSATGWPGPRECSSGSSAARSWAAPGSNGTMTTAFAPRTRSPPCSAAGVDAGSHGRSSRRRSRSPPRTACASIYTWTQTGNEGMRALNERLGYVYRSVSITVRADLPVG